MESRCRSVVRVPKGTQNYDTTTPEPHFTSGCRSWGYDTGYDTYDTGVFLLVVDTGSRCAE